MSYLVAGVGKQRQVVGGVGGLGNYGVYGMGGYGVYGLGWPDLPSPMDVIQTAGSKLSSGLTSAQALQQQIRDRAVAAAGNVKGAVQAKFGPKTQDPQQKTWQQAAEEVVNALTTVKRQAEVDGKVAQFDPYASLVLAFINGDMTQLQAACLSGDQLGALTASLAPKTADVSNRIKDMAAAAVDRKMDPPAASPAALDQSLTQVVTQIQTWPTTTTSFSLPATGSAKSASKISPLMIAGGVGALGLVAILLLKGKKKSA